MTNAGVPLRLVVSKIKVLLVAAVVDVVCIDVREAAVGSGAGLTSQCGRFCPAAGDVIGRRSVIVVNEQCYR